MRAEQRPRARRGSVGLEVTGGDDWDAAREEDGQGGGGLGETEQPHAQRGGSEAHLGVGDRLGQTSGPANGRGRRVGGKTAGPVQRLPVKMEGSWSREGSQDREGKWPIKRQPVEESDRLRKK